MRDSAFPIPGALDEKGAPAYPGVSRLEYYAGLALVTLGSSSVKDPKEMAARAFDLAAAMVAEGTRRVEGAK